MKTVILTGSGVSAESGISTFRDVNGLWRNHRIEEVASPHPFPVSPGLVHEFYDLRRRAALTAEPNAAHDALANLADALGEDLLLVTQNVDDLHERAGAKNVIHLHGELNSALCAACGARHRWTSDLGNHPACPACGARALRPDIVWFGEPVYRLSEVSAAVDACRLFVAIGTSGVVHPAAGLASRAKAHGAATVLLNLEGHEGGGFDHTELGPATATVPTWVNAVLAEVKG